MKRPWQIWIGFVLCLAVVLAAMGWISLKALDLDRAEAEALKEKDRALDLKDKALRHEAEARRQAARQENIRLALGRMDWWLAPFVARENARPYFVYRSFFPVGRAYTGMFNARGGGEMLWPSPLLGEVSPNILVHFQFEPDGRLTSPQVPTGDNRKLAVPNHVSESVVQRIEKQLARVGSIVDRQGLMDMLPEPAVKPLKVVIPPLAETPEQRLAEQKQRRSELQNRGRDAVEFGQRNQAIIKQANTAMGQQDVYNQFGNLSLPSTDVSGVLMKPLWLDGELILARRTAVGGREYVQGCLLDWPAIKESLLGKVDDLLLKADLQPVTSASEKEESRMLAALPVRLIPGREIPVGEIPVGPIPAAAAGRRSNPDGREVDAQGFLSSIWLSLGVAWGCVLFGAVAVAALLLGVIRLSERRASFVTAVTHELRTPLTTFQMYAEMLSEGMVSDGRQQQSYLNTLRAEATRLTHLVENVLSYARLERGRTDGRLEALTLDQLIGQIEDRLGGRAEHAGMKLVVERDGEVGEVAVQANVSAAEQILFNLVDNAGKYAAGASDKRIHLMLQHNGGAAQVCLRDHGPGVSPSARRRLFHAFSKSAQEAAHTAPGVGLGLALSRRLARDMGGDLRLDESVTDGACFVLTLAAGQIGGE